MVGVKAKLKSSVETIKSSMYNNLWMTAYRRVIFHKVLAVKELITAHNSGLSQFRLGNNILTLESREMEEEMRKREGGKQEKGIKEMTEGYIRGKET